MKSIRNFAVSFFALVAFFAVAPCYADDARALVVQKASVSVSAASGVASGTTTETSVTVPGAALGDACLASHSLDATGISISCKITAAGTAKVTTTQTTTNGVAVSSGTLRVFLFRKGTK